MKETVLRRMSNKLMLIAMVAQKKLFLKCAYAKTEPPKRKIKYNRYFGVMIAIITGLMFGFQNPQDAQVANSITHSNIIESSVIEASKTTNNSSKTSSGDTSTMMTVLEWVAGWVKILGGVIAFVGVVEVGYGFFKNDPGAKTQGWQIIVAGGIIASAGAGWKALINV